jgi:hypothetical protein
MSQCSDDLEKTFTTYLVVQSYIECSSVECDVVKETDSKENN